MPHIGNIAKVSYFFGGENLEQQSDEMIVQLSAISVTKTADKPLWTDDGPLTYTVVIENVDPSSPGGTISNIEFEDVLATEIVSLVPTSVSLNGTTLEEGTTFNYNPATGLLSIDNIDPLGPGESAEIVFQVTKN